MLDPVEVEAALSRVAGVAAVAVCVAERATTRAPCVVAFVVGSAGDDALRAVLREELPDDASGAVLVRPERLPRLATGAVDRPALVRRAGEATGSAYQPPTATEAAVAGIWHELGCTPASIDDDFFLAGGHSLLAAQLGARLSTLFDLEVPLPVLFDEATVAAQAAWIDRAAPRGRSQLVRQDRVGALPLSFAQERMWFFEELAPGSTVHHLQRAFRIDGALDQPALHRALAAVARRHEALRTIIVRDGGLPAQRIATEVVREHRDCEVAGADAIAAHCADELGRPFALSTGPLWRTSLVRIAAEAHVFVLTLHHLIADAWSLNVWAREVAEHYRAEREQRAPIVEQLLAQPADFAAWQRRAVADGTLDPHRAFWRTALARLPRGL